MSEFDDRVSPANVIVVGVDGSEHSTAAVAWAAAEADRRRAGIHLVYAWSPVVGAFSGAEAIQPAYVETPEEYGRTILDQNAVRITAAFPELTVTTELSRSQPAVELLEQAERALMTVVGAHGSNRILGMLVGSVALRLASHGTGPVVIVRDAPSTEPGEDHPVMVGLDGSDSSEEALSFAFEEASFRNTRLIAVRTWPGAPGDSYLVPYLTATDLEDIDAEQHRLLAEQLAGWCDKYPDVPVRAVVLRGPAAAGLVGLDSGSAALPATPALLVVGSRGRGGFAGLLLGSVGQALVTHAVGPVCIVHPRAR